MLKRSQQKSTIDKVDGEMKFKNIVNTHLVFLVLIGFSYLSHSETILCAPVKGVGVKQTITGNISEVSIDTSSLKYVLSDASGKWSIKKLGADLPMLMKCQSELLCSCEDSWCGTFIRDHDGFFTYFVNKVYTGETVISQVYKGRCSKI